MKNAITSTTSKQVFLIVLLGSWMIWLEVKSFASADFSELVWLSTVLVLLVLVRSTNLKQHVSDFGIWSIWGTLFWSTWRLLNWIFVDRTGVIWFVINILTSPLRNAMGMEMVEWVILLLIIVALILSSWATYWISKNVDVRWIQENMFWEGFLVAVVIIVAIYSAQPNFAKNCYGVAAYSEALSCHLNDGLGIAGSIWVKLTFLLWPIMFGVQQAISRHISVNAWGIALGPVWVAFYFNPTRILGVVWHNASKGIENQIVLEVLARNMRTLKLLPLTCFFIIIPVGLWILKSEKSRFWWTIWSSGIVLAVMLGIVFLSLDKTKMVFSYAVLDQVIFGLMAFQVWLPIAILAFVGQRLDVK